MSSGSNSGGGKSFDVEMWNAGESEVQQMLDGFKFDKVACWARALEGKAWIETGDKLFIFTMLTTSKHYTMYH